MSALGALPRAEERRRMGSAERAVGRSFASDVAVVRSRDYERAGVPMLPVVAGERVTRTQIGLYTIPMVAAAVAPWALGLVGAIYGWSSLALNAVFALLAFQVATRTSGEGDTMAPEKRLFKYSLYYLALTFAAIVADRWMA